MAYPECLKALTHIRFHEINDFLSAAFMDLYYSMGHGFREMAGLVMGAGIVKIPLPF